MRRLGIGLFCVCVLLCACALAQLRGETPSQRVPQINPRLLPAPNGQRVRIAEGVADQRVVRRVKPIYPPRARRDCVQGDVVLQIVIAKTGTVMSVRLVEGPESLVQAAISAVRQWRYRPFLLNGQAVEVETTATVHFKLPETACGNGRVQV